MVISPPANDKADLSLIRLRIGPAILGIDPGKPDMLPGMLGIDGIPGILDILGIGGIGAPPADGGSCPPAGDLTADTSADMETGET